jgi:hypothetical protein
MAFHLSIRHHFHLVPLMLSWRLMLISFAVCHAGDPRTREAA